MTELLDLCYDVLIRILEELHPAEITWHRSWAENFNEFLKKNRPLYKTLYLKHFVWTDIRWCDVSLILTL